MQASLAGVLGLQVRFTHQTGISVENVAFSTALPFLWLAAVALAGGYDRRSIGVGSDEFRKVLNAAVALTTCAAIAAYAARMSPARGYVAVALPSVAIFDLTARYYLRKRLYRLRRNGLCMQ